MSVNSISSSMATSYSVATSTISEETKQKLISLGIDPSTITSEMQAQQKIAEVKAFQKQNDAQSGSQGQGSSSEAQILSEAKDLASQVGVSVASTDGVSDILSNISDAISSMSDRNPMAQYFQERLSALDAEYSKSENSMASLNSMMSAMATSNKIALGLS